MEKPTILTLENIIDSWNVNFPDYPMTVADLKNSHKMMGALFHILNLLGIEEEIILKPPTEEESNKHFMYYWDLIPVVNMTRVFKHLISVNFGQNISIMDFLQPTVSKSHSILLLLLNQMLFKQQRLQAVAPFEEELFSKSEEVKSLEDINNKLIVLLNEQAVEKGKRVENIEKLNNDIMQLEEELKQEKEGHDEEKRELDDILNKNKETEVLLEKKKAHRDGLIAEVEKKKALRVYDADDIEIQAEQAAQDVQEWEEKVTALRATLMQKENCLKNLLSIKPNLDVANNLLHDIMKLSENIKDDYPDDLDLDTKDGELEVKYTELSELETQLAELKAAREEVAEKRRENEAKRQQERVAEKMNLANAEEKARKKCEKAKKGDQRVEEIKQLTFKYKDERLQGMEEIAKIKDKLTSELKTFEDALMTKTLETVKKIEEKLNNHKR